MAYKTPGVYIKEVSLFPPSVAEVATAIPAFIGYTAKAERKGEDLTNIPTRISSLLEYQELFGGESAITGIAVVVDKANGYAVQSATPAGRYYMFEALRLFFDNGGGACYIVSVGRYGATVVNGDPSATPVSPGLRVGLKAVEKYDEPTLLLFPDAPLLATDAEFYSLQQQALAQAATLQDRFAVLDLKESGNWVQAVQKFRDNIGINSLKYGAAYTPWLYSAYPKSVDFALFRSTVKDKANNLLDLATLTSDPNLNALVTAAGAALDDRAALKAKVDALRTTFPSLRDRYASLRNALNTASDATAPGALDALLDYARAVAVDLAAWKAALKGANLRRDIDAYGKGKARKAVEDLIALEKNDSVRAASVPARTEANVTADYAGFDATAWLSAAVNLIAKSATDYTNGGARGPQATALAAATDLDAAYAGLEGFVGDLLAAAATHGEMSQGTLYQGHSIIGNIVEHVKRELAEVPPSGAVVGVYAYVDGSRGVWKAPANVSLSSVLGPVEQIDFFEQEDLNVDVTGGKSINAIRPFTGLGTLVWGARTLAGNDNEWRYVPVRRFFNMVEESVKKSTSWAVFEPNDAPLWTKVKSMIDNYLVQKWRDGALAGATPEQAFFVKVGLGQTMTPQDILEGRLIVEIGMAVVRPAEFIILRFSHKMQEA